MKKLISAVLCFALLLSVVTALSVPVGAATYTGKCGDSLTWSLNSSTGVLTISGTGPMDNFSFDILTDRILITIPWIEHYPEIKTVKIGKGVTSIGDFAFFGCETLTGIEIPSGVTSIGRNAFYACSSLESVKLPDSLTSIGYAAFCLCTDLISIAVPEGVTEIKSDTFAGCLSMTSVSIPSSVTSVGEGAFDSCVSLEGVYITDVAAWCALSFEDGFSNPLYIASILYVNKQPLTDLVIPDGVTSIGAGAFYGCTSIERVSIPGSVTSIGDIAFSHCPSVESITVDKANGAYRSSGNCLVETATKTLIAGCKNSVIPSDGSVTSIGDQAFGGCVSLTDINIPGSVTSIGSAAFSDCYSLERINIPASVGTIGDIAFTVCPSIGTIAVDSRNGVYHSSGNCLIETAAKTLIAGCKNSVIPSDGSVETIGIFAFSGCADLTDIVVPDGVTSIGDFAFAGCESLAAFTVSGSVASIGEGAFYGCESLVKATVYKGLSTVGDGAFYECNHLKEILFTGTKEEWGAIAFGDGNDPVLNATVYFGYDPALDVITGACGDGLTWSLKIGGGALSISGTGDMSDFLIDPTDSRWAVPWENYLPDIKTVEIGDGVTSIGNDAFFGASSLTEIVLPDSVTKIGNLAFGNCSSLANVKLGKNLESIGSSAFQGCTSLASIAIPRSVTSIGGSAFRACKSLTSLIIPRGVTEIENGTFYSCSSLTEIVIPKDVTSIDSEAFWACTSLKSITIPESVTSVGNSAFRNCRALTDVYYTGSEEKWSSISIGKTGNDPLKGADVHFNYEIPLSFEPGDANGDGDISMSDVLLIRKCVAGVEYLTDEEFARADVTDDGDVTMSDVMKVRKIVAGVE